MTLLEELREYADALVALAGRYPDFFVSMDHYARRLRDAADKPQGAVSQSRLLLWAKEIDRFLAQQTPKDRDSSPTEVTLATPMVENINRVVLALKELDADAFLALFAEERRGSVGIQAAVGQPKEQTSLAQGLDAPLHLPPKLGKSPFARAGQSTPQDVSDASAATRALTASLEDPDGTVRTKAAAALGRIGPSAKQAGPSLIKVLNDSAWEVRAQAAYALGKIGYNPKDVVPRLAGMLQDAHKWVRSHAAAGLGFLSASADSAIPRLIKAAEDLDGNVRKHCVSAIGRIGTRAELTVPVLMNALDNEDKLVRSHAAQALGRLGPAAYEAVAKLAELSRQDPDPNVRAHAVSALGSIAPGASHD